TWSKQFVKTRKNISRSTSRSSSFYLRQITMRMFQVIIVTLLLASLATAQCGSKQGQATDTTSSALDKTADPCVDFYQFACDGWVKNNPIPADQPIWSRFGQLAERNLNVLHGILEDAAKAEKRTAN